MKFTEEQNGLLSAPLDRSHVKERPQGGTRVSFIEGWHAIGEANRIFGFDGWTRQTIEMTCVHEGEHPTKPGMFKVTYIGRVRIAVGLGDELIFRDGSGAGHGFGKDIGEAHESAIKEAETDAMKRALMTFGNPFGLALYDKAQANVEEKPDPAAAARAEYVRIKNGINDANDPPTLDVFMAQNATAIADLPEKGQASIMDLASERRDQLERKAA